MARSFGGILGDFKGKLGKVDSRIVQGGTIMAARPANFKESTSAKHAEVKQQFAVTISCFCCFEITGTL
jgi:predicted HNH restriction endonuclease